MADVTDWAAWPEAAADQRPKRLPHTGAIGKDAAEILRAKGWDPIDVRVMPNASDAERGTALKATLEGIRLGTIDVDHKMHKFLLLEAQALGLTSARGPQEDKPKDEVDKTSLKSIFGVMVEKPPALFRETRKTGRPPGSKTKVEEKEHEL